VDETQGAYKLAYDEAVRALSQQQTVLDNFRTRAGILLSAAAIATSFLGGQALRQASMSAWSWLAVLGFVGLSASTLLILWPRRDWEFAAIPRRLISIYIETENPLSVERIHRDLALHMQDSYDMNEARLERLIVYFRLAVVLLTVEVLAWVIDIASRS
jgi:hypothetical protein